MILGVTGSRFGMSDAQKEWALTFLSNINHRAVLHHGKCVGADQWVATFADSRGWDIVAHPASNVPRWQSSLQLAHERFVDAKPALERNRDIVDVSTLMLAFPDGPEKQRSGTWATIRYAIKVKKSITVVYPDGQVEVY